MKARILGLGSYLPAKVLTNPDLEALVETTDEWITARTGIKERRIATCEEFTSTMGAAAAKEVLAKCDLDPQEVDLILVATMTPDYISTSTAALIQNAIGAQNAAAMDIQAACSGFIYGLATAKAFVESGLYKRVLLIASEKMSSFVDYKDRGTCILFGDGAAAALIAATGKGLAIENVNLGADGSLAELLVVPGGGARHPASHLTIERRMHYFKMAGSEVFKNAVRRMGASAEICLQEAGLKAAEVNWLVPHQANMRIIDAVAKQTGIASEKVYKTVHKYGNTSASSIPLALVELLENEFVDTGATILLVGFGAGFTWGSLLLRVVEGEQ